MIRIQANIAATLLPEDYDSDGFLFFDLFGGTDLSFFKSIEQINDLNQITEEAVLGFTLPRTPKNIRICQAFDLEAVKDEPLPISVIVSVSGQTLRQNRLLVLNVNDEADSYECELERPTDHWISNVEFPLCELDFGKYTFTGATVASYNNLFPYQDGDTGIAFPIANYGVFLGRSNTPSIPGKPYFVENFRPWINPLKVLQDGFCKLGWQFECPLLETDYGRSLLTYILKDDLSIESQTSGQIFAAAEKTNFIRQSLELSFLYVDSIIFDTISIGGANFIGNEFFAAPGVFDIEVNFNVGAFAGTGNVEFILEMFKSSGGGSSVIASDRVTVPVTQSGPQNVITLNVQDVDLLANEIVFLRISYRWSKPDIQSIAPSIFYNGNFSARRKAGIPFEGDEVEFSKLIDCNYLFVDYLKGITHLFNFKFITDWASKKVIALTTDRQDIFGQTVDGYYLDTVKEIEPLRKSRSVLNKRNTNKRYALLEFAPTSDPGIQRQIQPQDDPIFSKRFDYGADLPDETVRLTNPFFEPTRNDSTTEVSFNGIPLNMPFIWDNTDNKLSFKISPRILYFIPQTQQFTGLLTGPTSVAYRGVGANATSYPWAFQVQPQSHFFFPAPFRIDENVVYGNVVADLSRYWARDLFARIVLKENTYKLLSTFNNYEALNFRLLYKIFYEGREYVGRLISVENQQTVVDLCDVTLQPEPNVPLCDLLQEPDETQICNNNPRIVVSLEEDCCEDEEGCDTCITVAIGGTNNSEVDTELIEASFDNGETWVEQNQFCCSDHEGEPFIIRITVTYTDGCPTIVRSRVIDPCEVLQSEIELICVFDENCASVEVEGLQDCEEINEIEYSINAGDRIVWDENPVCLESGDRIEWFVKVETECCGEVEFQTECFAEIIGCEFEPEVICEFTFDGQNIIIAPSGTLPDAATLDIIQYRCAGADCWETLDCRSYGLPFPAECECYEVKRIVVTCLEDCPVKCFVSECCFELPECVECLKQCAVIPLSGGTALALSIVLNGVTTSITGTLAQRTINCPGDNTGFENNLASFLKTLKDECEEVYVEVECIEGDDTQAILCIYYSAFAYDSINVFSGGTTQNIAFTGFSGSCAEG